MLSLKVFATQPGIFISYSAAIVLIGLALELGCDCQGYIHYFDALVTDSRGNVMKLANAICLYA